MLLDMKNVFILAIIVLVSFSCRKDYTCECKSTSTYPGSSPSTHLSNTGKMKKADAKAKCDEGDADGNLPFYNTSTNTIDYYHQTTECNIK